MTPYDAVNKAWPDTLPAITREEARRAAKRLFRHFAKRDTRWLRRCWVSAKPTTSHLRGWHRLVHDISHRIHSLHLPHFLDHGGAHADLERKMVEYVLSKGWLAGTLKPKVTPPRKPGPADKLAAHREALKRWETKRKRAETAIKKLRLRIRRAEKIVVDKVSTTK
jgi:hypothetical protein